MYDAMAAEDVTGYLRMGTEGPNIVLWTRGSWPQHHDAA